MKKYKTACAIVVNKRDEILLIKRGRDPFKDHWALISGIGESKKGIPPEIGIKQEVNWDLGTATFEGDYLFSLPIENDEFSDDVVVFIGTVKEDEIKMRPGFSEEYKWVQKSDLDSFENLAFEHTAIIKKYLQK